MQLIWKTPEAKKPRNRGLKPKARVVKAQDGGDQPCLCCQGLVDLRGRHPMDPTGEIFGNDHWPEPLPHEITTPSVYVKRQRRDPEAPQRPAKAQRLASGAVPLGDICTAENWDPKQVRQILRKNFPRPEGRWEFPKDQVEDVKKVIRDSYIA